MLRAYSALGNDSDRARLAETFTATHGPPSWHRVRAHVERIAAGEVRDVCPTAIGWGGRGDAVREGQEPIGCLVKTANWFYRHARPSERVLSAAEASYEGRGKR